MTAPIVTLVETLSKTNEQRLSLEKLCRDNGYEANIQKGQLDPKLIAFLGSVSLKLAKSVVDTMAAGPWQHRLDMVRTVEGDVRVKDGQWSAIQKAGFAYSTVEAVLRKLASQLARNGPQPDEDKINAFQAAYAAEDSPNGKYWLSSIGGVGTMDKLGGYVVVVSELLLRPTVTFPRDHVSITNPSTYVMLETLEAAIAGRDYMRQMAEEAREEDREREERRKVSKGGGTK